MQLDRIQSARTHRTLLARGGVVSPDRLIDQLWGVDPPANAANALQRLISRLRRDLGATDVVVTSPGGYALPVDASALDAIRFEDLVAEANQLREPDPPVALRLYDEALRLWRGPAYGGCVRGLHPRRDHAVGGNADFRNRRSDRS